MACSKARSSFRGLRRACRFLSSRSAPSPAGDEPVAAAAFVQGLPESLLPPHQASATAAIALTASPYALSGRNLLLSYLVVFIPSPATWCRITRIRRTEVPAAILPITTCSQFCVTRIHIDAAHRNSNGARGRRRAVYCRIRHDGTPSGLNGRRYFLSVTLIPSLVWGRPIHSFHATASMRR